MLFTYPTTVTVLGFEFPFKYVAGATAVLVVLLCGERLENVVLSVSRFLSSFLHIARLPGYYTSGPPPFFRIRVERSAVLQKKSYSLRLPSSTSPKGFFESTVNFVTFVDSLVQLGSPAINPQMLKNIASPKASIAICHAVLCGADEARRGNSSTVIA